MIVGTVVIEDHIVHFRIGRTQTEFIATEILTGMTENRLVDNLDFTNALAIAIHTNGLADLVNDSMQESAERAIGDIRWIP
jgi:hypothetical protein